MKTDLLLTFTFILSCTCNAHAMSVPRPSVPLVDSLNEITRHLRALTNSLSQFDTQLAKALTVNTRHRIVKRSTAHDDDDDSINCRLSLNEDMCQALEISRYMHMHPILTDDTMPGKRSLSPSPPNYQRIGSDLRRKKELVNTLKKVFDNAGNIMEREKKWLTCNLNLGFTCQTQEYSAIADYYDFLNSADSPGKKRSLPARSNNS